MTPRKLHAAIASAKRFITIATDAHLSQADKSSGQDDPYWGSKETGAAKRASMDLTRALADMRRVG